MTRYVKITTLLLVLIIFPVLNIYAMLPGLTKDDSSELYIPKPWKFPILQSSLLNDHMYMISPSEIAPFLSSGILNESEKSDENAMSLLLKETTSAFYLRFSSIRGELYNNPYTGEIYNLAGIEIPHGRYKVKEPSSFGILFDTNLPDGIYCFSRNKKLIHESIPIVFGVYQFTNFITSQKDYFKSKKLSVFGFYCFIPSYLQDLTWLSVAVPFKVYKCEDPTSADVQKSDLPFGTYTFVPFSVIGCE